MAAETQTPTKPNKPSFIMILFEDFLTRSPIPPDFIQNFGKEIPNKATLKVFPDKSWEVDVMKDGKILYFQKGWEMFVENNNLEHGDFLNFIYYGNSTFKVKIYGKTACEKEDIVDDDNSEPRVGQENQREKQIQRKRKFNEFDDAEVEKNVIHTDSDLSDDDKITGKKQARHRKKMQRNAVRGTASNQKSGKQTGLIPDKGKYFSSQHPFFQVKMSTSYLTNGFLSIPSDFRRKYLQEKDADIRVQISRKTWNLRIYVRNTRKSTKVAKIGGKWAKFVRDNDLKIGDMCIFEMIKSDDIAFRVYICRC